MTVLTFNNDKQILIPAVLIGENSENAEKEQPRAKVGARFCVLIGLHYAARPTCG
jgi:hypothetical protein